jgi:hypothetical protein
MDSIAKLFEILIGLFTLIAGLVTALWAYTKFILERGFLPPVRFYVTGKRLGEVGGQHMLDIKIHLHNIGSSTLVARNIRLDLLYIKSNDPTLTLFKDSRRAGRLKFQNSLIKDEQIDPSALIPRKISKDKKQLDYWVQRKHRGFLILEHDTFVQAGVDQFYTFVTMIPKNALCFLAWCSFQYAQKPSAWQKKVAAVSRKLGLIKYSLEHIDEPHTVEDVFWIGDSLPITVSAGT